MKTKLLLLTFLIIGAMGAYSQTTAVSPTRAKLEKVKADPKTKDRAAKADVHVVKKTAVIADTTSIKRKDTTAIVAAPKKKKSKN